MEKINFKDLPSTDTPIDGTNLNLLQTNVENAINGKILFEGNSGGDIELNDNVSNYNYIEFFYTTNNKISGSKKVLSNSEYATLDASLYSVTASKFIQYTRTVAISGTNISNYSFQTIEINNSSTNLINSNGIIITKIVGYK